MCVQAVTVKSSFKLCITNKKSLFVCLFGIVILFYPKHMLKHAPSVSNLIFNKYTAG